MGRLTYDTATNSLRSEKRKRGQATDVDARILDTPATFYYDTYREEFSKNVCLPERSLSELRERNRLP